VDVLAFTLIPFNRYAHIFKGKIISGLDAFALKKVSFRKRALDVDM